MADEAATEETTTTTEAATADETLGEAGKKALDTERRNARQAAKERDALAARLQEFEDRDKTESQRATEALSAAEKRAADADARALRLEIAAEKGLTPSQAKRLVGATREELEADAAELLETFKPATDDTADQVATSLDLGNRGTTTAAAGDPAADFAKFLNRQTGR
jgi:hypothetical protein